MSLEKGDVATLASEFLKLQRREIAARLRIIASTRNRLEPLEDPEAKNLLESFDTAIKKKLSFVKLIQEFKYPLELMGAWNEINEKIWQVLNTSVEEFKTMLEDEIKIHPIWENWLQQVKGVSYLLAGEVIGGFGSALDVNESLGQHFKTVSQMWAFAGLDVRDGNKAPRFTRGQKASFNSELRSVLVGRLGTSLKLARGGYYRLYLRQKDRLASRLQREGIKIVPANDLPQKNGKHYEPKDVISKGHLDNMARRKMVKVFVSHLWETARQLEGLEAGESYVFGVLGHPKKHYIAPIKD
jgi:hypothetical protein